MADRKLVSNVYVADPENPGLPGKWYGPAYPDNEVTAEVAKAIDNPAAWEGPAIEEGAGDFRFRADDFGEETAPNLREQVEQEQRDKEQADLDARAAVFGGTAAQVAEDARKSRTPAKKSVSKESGSAQRSS